MNNSHEIYQYHEIKYSNIHDQLIKLHEFGQQYKTFLKQEYSKNGINVGMQGHSDPLARNVGGEGKLL